MPYSNLLMMVILSLQLWALYLIIFLHKNFMAITLVAVSLILSAVIVVLSRKYNRQKQPETPNNDDVFDSISALFNQINQRHYQLHKNIEQLQLSLTSEMTNQVTVDTEFKDLCEQQRDLLTECERLTQDTDNTRTVTKPADSLKSDYRQRITDYQLNEKDSLKFIRAELTLAGEQLLHAEHIADNIRLKSLNASIGAARTTMQQSDFTQFSSEISKLVRALENNKNKIRYQLEKLSTEVNNRLGTLKSRESALLPDETSNTWQSQAEILTRENDLHEALQELSQSLLGMEQRYTGDNALNLKLLKVSEELNAIDKDYQEIKEYFIECMIHLDELKQGILSPDDFYTSMDRTNKMITELYDLETTTKITNDVLK